jgi:hypothetical protein
MNEEKKYESFGRFYKRVLKELIFNKENWIIGSIVTLMILPFFIAIFGSFFVLPVLFVLVGTIWFILEIIIILLFAFYEIGKEPLIR